jgi:hypothetical protein
VPSPNLFEQKPAFASILRLSTARTPISCLMTEKPSEIRWRAAKTHFTEDVRDFSKNPNNELYLDFCT